VYYKSARTKELSRAQLEEARRAFIGLLHRRRYSPHFILNNGDELLAIAHTEYVRALDKGVEIEDPVAWTINCAWRRTQNLLTAESRHPRTVSTEKLLDVPDESTPSPADLAEDEDRARKIRQAVGELEESERQLIALTYFEGMTVADAGRYLKWHPSRAKHTHLRAIRHLYAQLGVTSSDQLEIEIGLAAFLTFGGSQALLSLPAGIDAVVDKASEGAQGLWARMHDVARRFTVGGGNDAASAVASSGAGRAAGVCAAGVAVACFGAASGVVGPGIDGVLGGSPPAHQHRPAQHHRTASAPKREASPPRETPVTARTPIATEPEPNTSVKRETAETQSRNTIDRTQAPTNEAAPSEPEAEAAQVEEQTSGIARAASESTSTSSPPSGDAASSGSETASPTVTVTVTPEAPKQSSPSERAQVREEFGGFSRTN